MHSRRCIISNFYFTPIVSGEDNSPDTINTRLGGLDSAIAGLDDELGSLVIGAGTSQAETIAARTGINYKSGTPPADLSTTVRYAANDNYNVRAYGAVGNGSADDRAAIQAAIDAAQSAGGGVVFLPRGVYRLTSSAGVCLTLKNNVTLRGAGPQSILDFQGSNAATCVTLASTTDAAVEYTLIRNLSGGSGADAISSDVNTVRMRVRGVVIRGISNTKSITNIVAASSLVTVTAPAHGFTTGDQVYIYGTATNGPNSLDLMHLSITVVDANTFTDAAAVTNSATIGIAQKIAWFDCIDVLGPDAIVEGCDVGIGFYTGIRLGVTATRAKILHNTISSGFRGTMFDDGAPGASYCIVAHNHYDTLKQAIGKVETTCSHNHICDNIATNCSAAAYATASFEILGPFTTFERNHLFFTSPISDAAIDNAGIGASTGHIAIRDNTIQGHTGIGINIQRTMIHCVVSGNQVDGANTGIQVVSSITASPINYVYLLGNRITNSASYGMYLSYVENFVVQNNTIIGVTAFNGIRFATHCNYGSVVGNVITTTGTDGISQGDSVNICQYLTLVGNVIRDVGNSAGAGYNMVFSANAAKIAVVGNACDDTPETSSVRGSSIASAVVAGNATQKAVTVTGTSVIVANNI